jgi:hypothetical protein
MAEPQRDFEKLRKEQEKDDEDIFDELEKESKAFDKVTQSSSQSTLWTVSSLVGRTQKSSAFSVPSVQTPTMFSIYSLVCPTKTSRGRTARSRC